MVERFPNNPLIKEVSMKRLNVRLAIALITVCGILVSGVAYAKDKTTRYKVTITNITRGQIFSPPIVISHKKDFRLFSLGKPAPTGLPELAEDGMTGTLETELGTMDSVFQYKTAEPPDNFIIPGASKTVEIETKRHFRFLSVAAMLVGSNDAFLAIRGVYARSWKDEAVDARAYDAGTEVNNELCDFIPGPPCVNGNNDRDTVGAEEYVYIHSGIQGINDFGDLNPANDWQNPVATIMVQRVK
jgi:hypothetical protein